MKLSIKNYFPYVFRKNLDILFEMGMLYDMKGNYDQAFHFFKKAYQKDPYYWLADAVVYIPDTLVKLKQYEEALGWCDTILAEHSDDRSFEKQFGKKKKQIERLLKNRSK